MFAARQTDRLDMRSKNDGRGHLDQRDVVGRLGGVEVGMHVDPVDADFLRCVRTHFILVHVEDADSNDEILVVAVLEVFVNAVSGRDEKLIIKDGRSTSQTLRACDDSLSEKLFQIDHLFARLID
jgi:hypothetical protein